MKNVENGMRVKKYSKTNLDAHLEKSLAVHDNLGNLLKQSLCKICPQERESDNPGEDLAKIEKTPPEDSSQDSSFYEHLLTKYKKANRRSSKNKTHKKDPVKTESSPYVIQAISAFKKSNKNVGENITNHVSPQPKSNHQISMMLNDFSISEKRHHFTKNYFKAKKLSIHHEKNNSPNEKKKRSMENNSNLCKDILSSAKKIERNCMVNNIFERNVKEELPRKKKTKLSEYDIEKMIHSSKSSKPQQMIDGEEENVKGKHGKHGLEHEQHIIEHEVEQILFVPKEHRTDGTPLVLKENNEYNLVSIRKLCSIAEGSNNIQKAISPKNNNNCSIVKNEMAAKKKKSFFLFCCFPVNS